MLFSRLLLIAAALLPPVNAVNKGNFKTCDQARFCKNHRNVKPEKGYTLSSPLAVKGSKYAVKLVLFCIPVGLFATRAHSIIFLVIGSLVASLMAKRMS